ncbi:MAG: hypothetical protein JW791_02080 [Nanoarchaeota archaeon]|nr:hypothetical protein [Nanoarchaeota archaeon]
MEKYITRDTSEAHDFHDEKGRKVLKTIYLIIKEKYEPVIESNVYTILKQLVKTDKGKYFATEPDFEEEETSPYDINLMNLFTKEPLIRPRNIVNFRDSTPEEVEEFKEFFENKWKHLNDSLD